VIYKDIEYQVVQTASPSGWKWTMFLDEIRTRTGVLIVEHTPSWMRNTRSIEPWRIWIKQLNAA